MLDDIATPLSDERLIGVAETAMIGKGAEASLELLSRIVVKTLKITSENTDPGRGKRFYVQVRERNLVRLKDDQWSGSQKEGTS